MTQVLELGILTRAQTSALRAIERLTIDAVPPTVAELARELSVCTGTAYCHVVELRRKGYLRSDAKKLVLARKRVTPELIDATICALRAGGCYPKLAGEWQKVRDGHG